MDWFANHKRVSVQCATRAGNGAIGELLPTLNFVGYFDQSIGELVTSVEAAHIEPTDMISIDGAPYQVRQKATHEYVACGARPALRLLVEAPK